MSTRTAKRRHDLRETLENEIATGALKAGERLDEMSLAKRFGVSRTPIREALLQLASTGLVEIRPHRGAVVAAVGPSRLMEMFEVMAEIEAMCGRLAARRLTAADLATLRTAQEECRAAAGNGDEGAYYLANERFHHAIYRASRNGFLAEQAAALHRRLKPYRRLQLKVRNRMMASLAEHEAILAALADGDGERAAGELRAHIVVQGERFADLLASLADTLAPHGN
ncbi:GntR family transcriptional regulator [Chelatococcus sp. SYSU_G07232]|uniref:GntR family transcriptional regulator n=1 Tax=Chelatococcus albus TaxID=3047466 RepID=A0ABT7AID2_9HYPH|nr:GntR family transcriptional regulator [Chelatococcus sp. SYSU_G07232]MDJ1159118.1 GntR family transcriptional regulator [Chelatococcus sp. SYSU_G07232]